MTEIVTDKDKEINIDVKLELNDVKAYYYWFEKKAFFNRPINILVLYW